MRNATSTDKSTILDFNWAPDAKSLDSVHGSGANPSELDLERLVWDPEYRKEMRDYLKR